MCLRRSIQKFGAVSGLGLFFSVKYKRGERRWQKAAAVSVLRFLCGYDKLVWFRLGDFGKTASGESGIQFFTIAAMVIPSNAIRNTPRLFCE